jgi:hypothetical protein
MHLEINMKDGTIVSPLLPLQRFLTMYNEMTDPKIQITYLTMITLMMSRQKLIGPNTSTTAIRDNKLTNKQHFRLLLQLSMVLIGKFSLL